MFFSGHDDVIEGASIAYAAGRRLLGKRPFPVIRPERPKQRAAYQTTEPTRTH